jgi:hypothetical protein
LLVHYPVQSFYLYSLVSFVSNLITTLRQHKTALHSIVFICRACSAGFSHGKVGCWFSVRLFSLFRLLLPAVACERLGGRSISLQCRTWFGATFFSSILYVGRPGLHASLARREGCALANTHLFGLVWVMGMAWRGIPRLIIRKIPLNNYLEMIPYDFGATIARIWKSNLHTYTFSMLLCFSRGGENFS